MKSPAFFRQGIGAVDETRTRDLHLGKVALYQLSYYRMCVGAGDGNRTHVASLEGWNSTIELHPHRRFHIARKHWLLYSRVLKMSIGKFNFFEPFPRSHDLVTRRGFEPRTL